MECPAFCVSIPRRQDLDHPLSVAVVRVAAFRADIAVADADPYIWARRLLAILVRCR